MMEQTSVIAPTAAGAGPQNRPRATVSAVICTHNRTEQLRRALHSLREQRTPPDEIIVVDNAPSSDGTCQMVRGEFRDVRYVREPVPGLDFARNRALREARFEVVAFLDDDAVAHPEWADHLTARFGESPALGVCTGRVEALTLSSHGQQLFEANGGFGRGDQQIRLPADASLPLHGRRAPLIAWAVSVGSGASMAVRREHALAIGGFDEALDMGRALPGGGDHDMMWRMLNAGHDLVYDPRVCAWHEHRESAAVAMEQIIGHQRALIGFLTKVVATGSGSRGEALAFLGWRLLKPGVRLARRVLGRDPLPAAVLLRMWAHTWMGLIAYPLAHREAGRRRARHSDQQSGGA